METKITQTVRKSRIDIGQFIMDHAKANYPGTKPKGRGVRHYRWDFIVECKTVEELREEYAGMTKQKALMEARALIKVLAEREQEAQWS